MKSFVMSVPRNCLERLYPPVSALDALSGGNDSSCMRCNFLGMRHLLEACRSKTGGAHLMRILKSHCNPSPCFTSKLEQAAKPQECALLKQ